jgi:hypothetical protein
MVDEETLIVALLCKEAEKEEGKRRKKHRQIWVHDIWSTRDEKGEFVTLFNDLVQDEVKFKTYFRMSQEKFFYLLRILRERLQRKSSHFRKPISEIERLVITLS